MKNKILKILMAACCFSIAIPVVMEGSELIKPKLEKKKKKKKSSSCGCLFKM